LSVLVRIDFVLNLVVVRIKAATTFRTEADHMGTPAIRVVESGNRKFVEGLDGGTPLRTEEDVLNLIGICGENDTNRIMLHEGLFPESFFDLKSGNAGMTLQKFVNYHVRVAAIISPSLIRGKFEEFVAETNRGHQFRVLPYRDQAERWLLQD
jgi:hypothetical protein